MAGASRPDGQSTETKRPPVAIQPVAVLAVDGAPSTTRTCDLLDRNQTLYPTELWARFKSGAEAYRIGDDSEYLAVGAVCSELVSGRKSLIRWEDTGKPPGSRGFRRGCVSDSSLHRRAGRRVPCGWEQGNRCEGARKLTTRIELRRTTGAASWFSCFSVFFS